MSSATPKLGSAAMKLARAGAEVGSAGGGESRAEEARAADRLGLEATLRPRGWPPKRIPKKSDDA